MGDRHIKPQDDTLLILKFFSLYYNIYNFYEMTLDYKIIVRYKISIYIFLFYNIHHYFAISVSLWKPQDQLLYYRGNLCILFSTFVTIYVQSQIRELSRLLNFHYLSVL